MERISSLGVGSGLDLNSLVTQLVAAERAPVQNRLNRDQAKASAQLSALGSLKSAASRLKDVADDLAGLGTLMRSQSGDPDLVGVSTGTGAEAGRYRIQVSQLASAQSLASTVFADADAALGEGVLRIAVGDTEVAVEIGDGVQSLRQLRDAINASEAPVNAIVVADGGGFRLLLSAQETGAESAISVTVDGTVDANLASAAMTETAAARDAVFRLNGLELTSGSNQLDDLAPGVSLTLRGETTGEGVEVVVSPDHDAMAAKLQELVTAYNALVSVIGSTGRADPEGGNAGALVGNATLRSLQARISGVFSAPVETGEPGSARSSLLDLGFSTGLDGRVSLDRTRLDAALADGSDDVAALVAGFAASVATTLDGYTAASGLLDTRISGLNDRLSRVADQRRGLDERMEQVESRLRKQFAALDTLLSQFQRTSSYLESQLASLANLQPRGNGG